MGHGAFWWRGHEGKRPYTEAEAKRVAARRNRHIPNSQPQVNAYPCAVCPPNWHVGHGRGTGHRLRSGAA